MELAVNDRAKKVIYWIVFGSGVAFLLAAIPCYFSDRAFIRDARPYEATIVDFVKMEGRDSDHPGYYTVVTFDCNGQSKTLESISGGSMDSFDRKQKIGSKLAVLYRDGDESFREDTFAGRWLWSMVMLIMAGLSFFSLPVCWVIFKLSSLLQFKK